VTLRNQVLVVIFTCALASSALEASQVRSLDLGQMTHRAARIFAGRCVSSKVVFDPVAGAEVTVATFRVDRAVKGVSGRTVTVRMSGASSDPGSADAHSPVPIFSRGEEVVLFLYGESSLGLSAPVGLGQGRFEVITDKQGVKRAINAAGNENLTRGQGRGVRQADLADPRTLLDEVERMVAGE
jgi:hypothetical protein